MKRRRSAMEEEEEKEEKAVDRFFMTPHDTYKLVKWVLQNGRLSATIPDSQWLGYSTKCQSTTNCIVTSLHVHKKKGVEVLTGHGSSDCSSFPINADMLLVSKITFEYFRSCRPKPDLTPVFDRLAQERANTFAKLVASDMSFLKKNKQLDLTRDTVLILDGPGRNVNALLEAGVPGPNILILERERSSAVHHLFLDLVRGTGVRSKWTGKEGYEGFILKKKLREIRIRWAYLDACGDLSPLLPAVLATLTKDHGLRLLGLTRGRRNCFKQFPTTFGTIIHQWKQLQCICKFFADFTLSPCS